MRSGGFKELTKKTLAIVIGTIIGLIVAETLTRVYVFGWDGLNYSGMRTYLTLKDSGFLQPAKDSRVLYELKPGLNTSFRFNSLKTNQQGLRDINHSFKKGENSIRVAIIGDSYTMGWGVESGDSYPDLLEQELNTIGSAHYEVINFGVPGYSLKNYIGVLDTKVFAYSPDLILFGFCEKNDFQKPVNEGSGLKFEKDIEENGFFRSYLLALIRRTIRVNKSGNLGPEETNESYLKEVFTEIHTIAEEQKIPAGIIYLSIEPQENSKRVVRNTARESNIYFIDASSGFAGLSARDFVINVLDSHPDEKAHKIFSNEIMKNKELRSLLGLKNAFD